MKKYAEGKPQKESYEAFIDKFGDIATYTAYKSKLNKLKIKGEDRHLKVPFNKGKKWSEWMTNEGMQNSLTTTFKQGDKPNNTLPAGSEVIDSRGDVYIKLEKPKNNTKHGMWEKKSRWVYEQHHGKIPEGYKVTFLDGDKLNFDINNLILITNQEQAIACSNKLYCKDNGELNKSGILLAKVINQINKKEEK